MDHIVIPTELQDRGACTILHFEPKGAHKRLIASIKNIISNTWERLFYNSELSPCVDQIILIFVNRSYLDLTVAFLETKASRMKFGC